MLITELSAFPAAPTPGKPWLIALMALLLALHATACGNDAYRWRDARGQTHYSDRPGADRVMVKTTPPASGAATTVQVAKVYDGDTITLEDGEKVRLLGINTPEIQGRHKTGEAGGEQARAWLKRTIAGRRVRIEQDVVTRDRYQRLLAHLFAEEGIHINLALVEAGLATTDIHPPNVKYVDTLVAAERRAEQENRGLWALPEYQPKPVELVKDRRLRGWQRLFGKPYAVQEGRGYWRLLFNDRLEVRIPKDSLSVFPPLQSYLHQVIEVRGWASRRGDGHAILVRHPSALIRR